MEILIDKQHRTLQSLLSRHVGIHTIASHQINGHLPSTYLYQPTDFYISSPFLPKTSSRPLVKLWSKFYLCRKLSRGKIGNISKRISVRERVFFFFLGWWGGEGREREGEVVPDFCQQSRCKKKISCWHCCKSCGAAHKITKVCIGVEIRYNIDVIDMDVGMELELWVRGQFYC